MLTLIFASSGSIVTLVNLGTTEIDLASALSSFLNLNRVGVFSVNENTGLNSFTNRSRNTNIGISQGSVVSPMISRNRGAAFGYSQAISDIIALNKQVGNSFSYSESQAIAATIQTLGQLGFSIAETESHVATIAKQLNVQFSNAEVQSISAALQLFKTDAFACNEILTYVFNNQRGRNVALTIAESQSVSAFISRILALGSQSDQELVTDIFVLIKQEGLGLTIAETQSLAGAIVLNRNDQATLSEIMSLAFIASRNRQLNEIVAESELLFFSSMARNRDLGQFSIAEVESMIESTLVKVKLLQAQMAEFTGHSFSAIRRIRNAVASLTQISTLVANQINRVLTTQVTASQQQTLSAILARILSLQSTVAEVESQTSAIGRNKTIATLVSEAETMNSLLTKLKLLAFIESQNFTYEPLLLKKLIRANVSLSSFDSMVSSLNRAKVFISAMPEDEVFTLDFGRIRTQMLNITQSQGSETALARLREIIETISNVTGYSFTLRDLSPDHGSILMEWTEWQSVNGVLTQVERSETVAFQVKYDTQVMILNQPTTQVSTNEFFTTSVTSTNQFLSTVVIPTNSF